MWLIQASQRCRSFKYQRVYAHLHERLEPQKLGLPQEPLKAEPHGGVMYFTPMDAGNIKREER
jgi:hypothetical protein